MIDSRPSWDETHMDVAKVYARRSKVPFQVGAAIIKNNRTISTGYNGWDPKLGKDKRGVSGVAKNKIIEIGKKLTTIPNTFVAHKTIKKIFDLHGVHSAKTLSKTTIPPELVTPKALISIFIIVVYY